MRGAKEFSDKKASEAFVKSLPAGTKVDTYSTGPLHKNA